MAKFNIDKTLEQIAMADLDDQIALFNKFKTELTKLLFEKAKLYEEHQNRMLGIAQEINVTNKTSNNGNQKIIQQEETKTSKV